MNYQDRTPLSGSSSPRRFLRGTAVSVPGAAGVASAKPGRGAEAPVDLPRGPGLPSGDGERSDVGPGGHPVDPIDAVNSKTALNRLVDTIMPRDLHREGSHSSVANMDPAQYRPRIDGSVKKRLVLAFDDPQAMASVSRIHFIDCTANGWAKWKEADESATLQNPHGLVSCNEWAEELKCTEQALRESERRFRDYAETATDWFWETGPDYKLTLLTGNAFGSGLAGRIGAAWWDHAADLETEPEKWRVVREALDARRPFRDLVYRSVSGSGTPMYVKAGGKPMFDAEGEFRGYRGTGTDVTATMRAREDHEKLRQLECNLAHMNRLGIIGGQAASLVHEITQSIATARNNAQAALNFLDRQSPELSEAREALGCVVGDADRAVEIIDRIRDHVRKAPPRKARFDLNDAIDEAIVLGRSAITKNGVLVQTRLAQGLSPVQGDRVQVQQVILNLVLNAVEAMGSAEAAQRELLISTEQTEANGVLVAVRDFGPGIDPEQIERIFEAFYTTKSSGVGMGLAICRSIIDVHGGRLWAEANEPRGAVFQFTLPGVARSS